MKEIDDVWRGWFVGLTDGEGSFQIDKRNHRSPGANYHCHFTIALRDDDRAILEEIRDTLGIGKIYDKPDRSTLTCKKRPQVEYRVGTIADCAELVKLFDTYPLRAKKRRDFEIWKQAVAELQKPVDCRDPDLLEYYFHAIKAVRQYEPVEPLARPITINLQLSIEWGETNV